MKDSLVGIVSLYPSQQNNSRHVIAVQLLGCLYDDVHLTRQRWAREVKEIEMTASVDLSARIITQRVMKR